MENNQVQTIVRYKAKPAGEFEVGDTIKWNFGEHSTIVGIVKETEKTITFKLDDGISHFSKSRLLAIG